MLKVKIFTGDASEVEEKINNWIEKEDISWSTTMPGGTIKQIIQTQGGAVHHMTITIFYDIR